MSEPAPRRLQNRTAIVTGGGSGIGRAVAELFSIEGARVLLVGRSAVKLRETAAGIAACGGEISVIAGDVADPASADRIDTRIEDDFDGELDVLVNCAGIYELCPARQLTVTEWRRSIDTNLRGPFLLMRRALARMVARRKGSVVNVSTVNALIADPGVGVTAYAASKGALNGLTRQAGVEYAARGVRVNAVIPGVVDTEMISEWRESETDIDAWLRDNVPLGRIARPEEVASVCLFLASDDAHYITASLFPVDGGMTAL